MKVWTTLDPSEIRECADEIGVQIHSDWAGNGIMRDGRAWNFRLALRSGVKRGRNHKYQRMSAGYNAGERRVAAVCWHGHRDFMRAIYRRDPDARIKSAFADYRGSEEFEQKFPTTGDRNIGSMYYPTLAREACTCGHDEWDVETRDYIGSPNGYSTTMRQSDLSRCPFFILMPEHYREDGTCKCDNPEHREMMIREWEYSEEDFRREGVIA